MSESKRGGCDHLSCEFEDELHGLIEKYLPDVQVSDIVGILTCAAFSIMHCTIRSEEKERGE